MVRRASSPAGNRIDDEDAVPKLNHRAPTFTQPPCHGFAGAPPEGAFSFAVPI